MMPQAPKIDACTALLLVDVQQGFDDPVWGTRNNPQAEQRMADLLAMWREHRMPVVHVQHCSTDPASPLHPDRPGCLLQESTAPVADEPLYRKSVNSAFIGTGLEAFLRQRSIDSLVIVGLTTDHCISTTTRMAGNLGFEVTLVRDATATFDRTGPDGVHFSAEQIHTVHLASLHREFCVVRSSAEVLAALASSTDSA